MPPGQPNGKAELQEISRKVDANEQRIEKIKRRLQVAEIRLGIKQEQDDEA